MSRGDRHEGIKSRPVSGGNVIELVSAVSGVSTGSILESCQLKFYVPQPYTINDIVVQELRPDTFYWLDRVQKEWHSGFNYYQWSAKEVIKPLKIEDISKLGVVVRLDKQSKEVREYVVPTAFYSGDMSSSTSEYYFTFRSLAGISDMSYEIYDEQSKSDTPLLSSDLAPVYDTQTFVVRLEGKSLQREGFYELLVKGVTSGSSSMSKKIFFYHRKP
jgi:hypothetical protein